MTILELSMMFFAIVFILSMAIIRTYKKEPSDVFKMLLVVVLLSSVVGFIMCFVHYLKIK